MRTIGLAWLRTMGCSPHWRTPLKKRLVTRIKSALFLAVILLACRSSAGKLSLSCRGGTDGLAPAASGCSSMARTWITSVSDLFPRRTIRYCSSSRCKRSGNLWPAVNPGTSSLRFRAANAPYLCASGATSRTNVFTTSSSTSLAKRACSSVPA